MGFRTLEVIRTVQRIEPSIQQEPCPIALAEHETACAQSMLVLRQDEVDLLALQVLEGGDNTFWWNDRLSSLHCLVQLLWLHDILLDGDRRVHDQGVFMKEPEVFRVRVQLQGMSHSRQLRP